MNPRCAKAPEGKGLAGRRPLALIWDRGARGREGLVRSVLAVGVVGAVGNVGAVGRGAVVGFVVGGGGVAHLTRAVERAAAAADRGSRPSRHLFRRCCAEGSISRHTACALACLLLLQYVPELVRTTASGLPLVEVVGGGGGVLAF